MAIIIRKTDKSKLKSADLFLKNSPLERQIWVPKSVLQNFKTKKPLLKGLFRRREF